MRGHLVKQLRCPVCDRALQLTEWNTAGDDVRDGLLRCDCGLVFALWRGVPRMRRDEAVRLPGPFLEEFRLRLQDAAPGLRRRRGNPSAFDAVWSMDEYGDETWGIRLDTRVGYFHEYANARPGSLAGLRVLDAGSGNGTLTAALASTGIEAVGLEFSVGAELAEAHKSRFARGGVVDYVQGDITEPPFAPESFDIVYCDGVIHYTPDPGRTFRRLAGLVKPGGTLIVTVSRGDSERGTRRKHWMNPVRAGLAAMPKWMYRPLFLTAATALHGLHGIQYVIGRRQQITPLRQKAVTLCDMLTSPWTSYHTAEDVAGWYAREGFVDVTDVTAPALRELGIGFRGARPLRSAAADAQSVFVQTS